ncbi:leucine-rich repeat domain-containing protein [Meridianimaribacter flavus]|uniref:Leucine-rich repeat domain-containing protein n=1 Tax=Meridianimaribacter flavus TaxID=571115 RepID=A0ABY2G5E9_9FLAO|nr:leucine-rich repeat domain-containing protein [Meridianimaribacter flavus]TDY12270.1 hypothetical protein A8975_1033 [Meridianimaribacter flavus]
MGKKPYYRPTAFMGFFVAIAIGIIGTIGIYVVQAVILLIILAYLYFKYFDKSESKEKEQPISDIKDKTEQIVLHKSRAEKKPTEVSKKIDTNKSDFEWWNHLDKEWKSIFLENIDNPINKDIGIYDLSKIKSTSILKIDNKEIKSLLPLTFLENLKELYLARVQIQDFSPIQRLTKLEKLELIDLNLKEVGFLSYLDDLKHLNLSNNKISSRYFEPIENLNSLVYLNMSNNEIHSFGGYYNKNRNNFSQLEKVDLTSNKVQNLADLSMLKNLKTLILKDNYLDKIEYLHRSTNLKMIDLKNNILEKEQILDLKNKITDCEIKH